MMMAHGFCFMACAPNPMPNLAAGETVILRHPFFIPIETPNEGRGGSSRMTLSPTASRTRHPTGRSQ